MSTCFNRSLLCWVVVTTLLFCAIPLWSAPVLSVAVSELEPQGLGVTEAAIITDRLRQELLNTGSFRVMERGMMDELLKEQSLQESGACNSSQCQVQMGRLLGVDRIVVGRVGKFGSMYTLTVRMLHVETGEILIAQSEDHEGAMEGLLKGPLRTLANRLVGTVQDVAKKDKSKNEVTPAPQPEAKVVVNQDSLKQVLLQSKTDEENKKRSTTTAIADATPKVPEKEKSTLGKTILRIGLGLGVVAFGGGGFALNESVKSSNDEAQNYLDDFMSGNDYAESDFRRARDGAETDAMLRNVSWVLSGACAAGFLLTFTF